MQGSNINTEKYWDDKFRDTSVFRKHPFGNIIRIIKEFKPAPQEVVDLGCALGDFQAVLKENFPAARIIGVDFSSKALQRCREKHPEMEWVKTELSDLAIFEDSSVDVVTIIETLEHLDSPEKTIAEIYRILRKGGIGLVSVPKARKKKEPEHVNEWKTEKEFGSFIEKTKFGKSCLFRKHGRARLFKWLNLAAVLIKK